MFPMGKFNDSMSAQRALEPGPTRTLASCAGWALCAAWMCFVLLGIVMGAVLIYQYLYPNLFRDFVWRGGSKISITAAVMRHALIYAPIGAVTASVIVWIVNRKRRRVLQNMVRTRACFECGYSLQQHRELCPECGSKPVFQVQLRSPAPSVSVFLMGAPELTSLFRSLRCGKLDQHSLPVIRGLLSTLIGLATLCFFLAVLAFNFVPRSPIFGLMGGLILLGFLTVKHLELRSIRVLPSS